MIPSAVSGCGKPAGNGEPTPAECREVAEFLQGFANPLRVEILCDLRDGEKSVGEIARRADGKQSNISQQLRVLLGKGCVARRREERNVYYRVRQTEIYEVLADVFQLVCGGE